MLCRQRVGTSFIQGDRWKKLISRYMKVMPPMGSELGSETQSMLCASFVETQAINAKVGEAARTSHFAGSRVRRVSADRFLASMDVVMFPTSS